MKESTDTRNGRLLFAFGSIITLILGATMRGDWILILVHFLKSESSLATSTMPGEEEAPTNQTIVERYHMQNAHWMVLATIAVSLVTYYTLGGWLSWYYYHRQKENPESWKCQPSRWLTAADARHELALGSVNMCVGGALSGLIAAHVLNGGYNTLYFHALERGWPYLILSTTLVFILQDCLGFYSHKMYHIPVLYRWIHKHHHRYHSPTVWSATAMHPLEFFTYQFVLALPMFVVPVYSGAFIACLLYNYYYGMLAHSGIYFESVWPWQPSTLFHDNHHKYFHTNFGFNTIIWDWLHDTIKRDDRVYGEHIFDVKKAS